jgi:predicted nucleotidyltransferase
MKSFYMDISNKFDDPIFAELLLSVQNVAAELDVPFFVVGATARDLLLWYGHGIRPGRATKDIDFGFSVSSWEQYDDLKKALVATGDFVAIGEKQRMHFRRNTKVDVLPFGQIVDSAGKITWRPEGDTELNLLGFDEAFENSIVVKISSDPFVEVKIASAVGLVLLKLFAWDDRKPRNKDAIDLGILIRSYMEVGNGSRIYGDHDDLLNNENFDYDRDTHSIIGTFYADIYVDNPMACRVIPPTALRPRSKIVLSPPFSIGQLFLIVNQPNGLETVGVITVQP